MIVKNFGHDQMQRTEDHNSDLYRVANFFIEAYGPLGKLLSVVAREADNALQRALFLSIRGLMRRRRFSVPKRIIYLEAHGIVANNGESTFAESFDGKHYLFSIEDWISFHEKEFDTIAISACNVKARRENGRVRYSKGIRLNPRERSFLIYPTGLCNNLFYILAQFGLFSDKLVITPPGSYCPRK